MARYLMKSRRPRETKLIQRATLHPIAGPVENIKRTTALVNSQKCFWATSYFDALNLRWYRSITLFDKPVEIPNIPITHTANQFHSLNNSQRYLRPTVGVADTTTISSPVHHEPPSLRDAQERGHSGVTFRAG